MSVKTFATDTIRKVAVAGHSGTGKTSLVSAMLFDTGAVNRLLKVDDGNTITDFDEDERERKNTINTAVAHVEHKGCKINLLSWRPDLPVDHRVELHPELCPAPQASLYRVEAQQHVDRVVLSGIRPGVLQHERLGVGRRDMRNVLRRFEYTFKVETSQHLVDKSLAGFKERNRAKAEIQPDPHERFEKGRQLALNVEQALGPLADALDQFGAIEFTVTHRLIVQKLGLFVVEIETDDCLDVTLHCCLNE